MLSTSLESGSANLFCRFEAIKMLVVVSVCIRHLHSPTFSPTSSVCRTRLIASALHLVPLTYTTHTHTKTLMLQPYTHTAPLIWNINLHFSPLHCKQCTSTLRYHITHSHWNLALVLFTLVFFCCDWRGDYASGLQKAGSLLKTTLLSLLP